MNHNLKPVGSRDCSPSSPRNCSWYTILTLIFDISRLVYTSGGEEVTLDEVFKMNKKSPEKPPKRTEMKQDILSDNEVRDWKYRMCYCVAKICHLMLKFVCVIVGNHCFLTFNSTVGRRFGLRSWRWERNFTDEDQRFSWRFKGQKVSYT